MKVVLLFLASTILVAGQTLLPDAEFDLTAGLKQPPANRHSKSYFGAGPGGLLFLTIGESDGIHFTSADLDGRNVHMKSDLAATNAHIDSALPRPDGNFWLVSSGPYHPEQSYGASSLVPGNPTINRPASGRGSSGSPADYTNLDLYDRAGEHLESICLLNAVGGLTQFVAASNNKIVLRSTVRSSTTQLIHFDSAVNGEFQQGSQVRLEAPDVPLAKGRIPVVATTGELLLIDKAAGSMMVIHPRTTGTSVVALSDPHPVQAAATNSDLVYLLSSDSVLKTDLSGKVISVYRLQFRSGFEPVSLGVTGNMLFVVDRSGNVERFTMN